jgi:hypothetical protein
MGEGCLMCQGEADAAYEREFPDGPKPIATFDTSSPEGIEDLKEFLNGVLGINDKGAKVKG